VAHREIKFMKIVIIISIAFVLFIPLFTIPALAQEDGGFFGFTGNRCELLGECGPQNPTEEAEQIVEMYYSDASAYLFPNNDDFQLIADLMNEYITKITKSGEEFPRRTMAQAMSTASSEEEAFDCVLALAGLKEEFYSSFANVWRDIAKDKLEMLDSLETKRKNQIRDLEIDDSLKESSISEITKITNFKKNEFASEMAKIIEPLEEKSNPSSLQNKIKDEILGQSSNGGGCLIATATFGSELAPQVQQLREIRDNSLLQTESGSAFMELFNQFYYSFSPTIADLERENPVFKEVVKLTITPLLSSLSLLNYVDVNSESEVLGYGISLILLNVAMYFVLPAIVIHRVKKLVS